MRLPPAKSILASALGLSALTLYVLTLYPTVGGGDSGELIAAAHTLGVAHPPGYPLFTLLGKLFSLIPHGTIAWRMNFLSAVCDSGAAALLFLAVEELTESAPAAWLAAGLFAFSSLVWSYATTAEVFPLNNLFLAAIFRLTVAYSRRPSRGIAYAGAFLFGLGLANHHTLVFFGLPLSLWVLREGRTDLLKPRPLAALLALFFAGLLPYAYLPWASARVPVVGWGDQTTLAGFLTHIFRTEYGTFALGNADGSADFKVTGRFFEHVWVYLRRLPGETAFFAFPLALGGLAASVRRKGFTLERCIALSAAFYLCVFFKLSNITLDDPLNIRVEARFWQLAHLFVCAWAGIGLVELGRRYGAGLGARLPRALGAAAGLLVALQIGLHYRDQDQHANWTSREFAGLILDTLPPRTLLFTSADYTTFILFYHHYVEGRRPDVGVVDHNTLTYRWSRRFFETNFPGMVLPGTGVYEVAGFNMKDFLDVNLAKRPVYTVNGLAPWDKSFKESYPLWPLGLSERVLRAGEELPVEEWIRANAAVFGAIDPLALDRFRPGTWEFGAREQYWDQRRHFAEQLLIYATRHGNPRRALEASAALFEELQKLDHGIKPGLYKNLGLAYHLLNTGYGAAKSAEVIRAWNRYVELVTPASDPELPAIRGELAKYTSAGAGAAAGAKAPVSGAPR